jgi:hypothetical protein
MVELTQEHILTKRRLELVRDDLLRITRLLNVNTPTCEFIRDRFVEESYDYENLILNLELICASIVLGQNTI